MSDQRQIAAYALGTHLRVRRPHTLRDVLPRERPLAGLLGLLDGHALADESLGRIRDRRLPRELLHDELAVDDVTVSGHDDRVGLHHADQHVQRRGPAAR